MTELKAPDWNLVGCIEGSELLSRTGITNEILVISTISDIMAHPATSVINNITHRECKFPILTKQQQDMETSIARFINNSINNLSFTVFFLGLHNYSIRSINLFISSSAPSPDNVNILPFYRLLNIII